MSFFCYKTISEARFTSQICKRCKFDLTDFNNTSCLCGFTRKDNNNICKLGYYNDIKKTFFPYSMKKEIVRSDNEEDYLDPFKRI